MATKNTKSQLTPEILNYNFDLGAAMSKASELGLSKKYGGGGAFTQLEEATKDLNYAKQQQAIVLGRGASQLASGPQVADYDETIKKRTAEIQNLVGILQKQDPKIAQAGLAGLGKMIEENPFDKKGQLNVASMGKTGGIDLAGLDPNAMVTVKSPSGKTREVTASQAGGFTKSGWTVTGQTGAIRTPEATNGVTGMPQGNFTATPDDVHTLKGYDTNNNYAPVYVKPGEYVPGVSLYPKPTDGISPEKMANENNIKTPIITGNDSASSAAQIAVDQATADIKAHQDLINATKTPEQTQDENLLLKQVQDIASLEGKAAEEIKQHQALVDPLEAQLTSITNQMGAITAEKERARLDREGQPMTLSRLAGTEARQNAIFNSELLSLSAQANAMMNNITLAESQVQQAIDAKYAPIEERIAIAQAQRDALAPTLSKQEKIQMDALNAIDVEKKQAIADQKDIEKANLSLSLSYIKEMADAGKAPDQSIISQIQKATNTESAVSIYGANTPLAVIKATGGSGGGGGGTTESAWDSSKQFIIDNPDASDEELYQALRENTDLSITDVNSLVKSRETVVASSTEQGEYNAESTAQYLHDNFSRKEALKEIEGYDLTEEQKDELANLLQDKRSVLQKILPFGK